MPEGAEGWPRALQGDIAALKVLAGGVVVWWRGSPPTRSSGRGVPLWTRSCRSQTPGKATSESKEPSGSSSTGPWERSGGLLARRTWLVSDQGMDLASRLYRWPEERQVGDIDVLVAARTWARRGTLSRLAGGEPAAATSACAASCAKEGYNVQLVDASEILLELHFRFWG